MKNEIMQRLALVLSALNSISVNGKQNLGNLGGSIAAIEEIAGMLEGADIIGTEKAQTDK